MSLVAIVGHLGHGKTSLARALTGDRSGDWIEERLRALAPEVEYHRLGLGDGTCAMLADVPGHPAALSATLAAAAGVDLVVLVAAADEGPRAQTEEHAAIFAALGVRCAAVALTKSDLVAERELHAVRERVRGGLGGMLDGDVPMQAVSTKTGDGVPEVRALLIAALARVASQRADAPTALAVDGVVPASGGAMLSGTLVHGRLAVGDVLALMPPGVDVTVAALHSAEDGCETIAAPARVQVAVAEPDALAATAGALLVERSLKPAIVVEARVRAIAATAALLRPPMRVRVVLGAAEVLALLVSGPRDERPEFDARLIVDEPVIAPVGMRIVIRRAACKTVLAAGDVVAAGTLHVDAELPVPPDGLDRITDALCAAGPPGASSEELAETLGVNVDRALALIEHLIDVGGAYRLVQPTAYVDARIADELVSCVRTMLRARERRMPWIMGTTTLSLARRLEMSEFLLARHLDRAVADGLLAERIGYVASPSFAPHLTEAQRRFCECATAVDATRPFAPRSLRRLREEMRDVRIEGIAQVLETLIASGLLVRVGADDVYRSTQLDEVRARLDGALRRDGAMTASAFRDLIGTSRRHAVPLLEWFDAIGVTVRDGDLRRLRDR